MGHLKVQWVTSSIVCMALLNSIWNLMCIESTPWIFVPMLLLTVSPNLSRNKSINQKMWPSISSTDFRPRVHHQPLFPALPPSAPSSRVIKFPKSTSDLVIGISNVEELIVEELLGISGLAHAQYAMGGLAWKTSSTSCKLWLAPGGPLFGRHYDVWSYTCLLTVLIFRPCLRSCFFIYKNWISHYSHSTFSVTEWFLS